MTVPQPRQTNWPSSSPTSFWKQFELGHWRDAGADFGGAWGVEVDLEGRNWGLVRLSRRCARGGRRGVGVGFVDILDAEKGVQGQREVNS